MLFRSAQLAGVDDGGLGLQPAQQLALQLDGIAQQAVAFFGGGLHEPGAVQVAVSHPRPKTLEPSDRHPNNVDGLEVTVKVEASLGIEVKNIPTR